MTSNGGDSQDYLRNFKVAIEFKFLMKVKFRHLSYPDPRLTLRPFSLRFKHAPSGVYLIPEFDSMISFHGVIFVRRGYYRDGVFRFVMTLPNNYSSRQGSHPQFRFNPPIFNPLVDMETGTLDISAEPSMREWQPERHFILNALTFLKSIFYLKSFDAFDKVANPAALEQFNSNLDGFRQAAAQCARESLGRIHDPVPAECPIVFTEPKPAHDLLKMNILKAYEESTEGIKETAVAAEKGGTVADEDDEDKDEEDDDGLVLHADPPA